MDKFKSLTQRTNTSRRHDTPNHRRLKTGLQASWRLHLSALPPNSGTIYQIRWKFSFTWSFTGLWVVTPCETSPDSWINFVGVLFFPTTRLCFTHVSRNNVWIQQYVDKQLPFHRLFVAYPPCVWMNVFWTLTHDVCVGYYMTITSILYFKTYF